MSQEDQLITSGKQLAEFATELLDSEVQAAYRVIVSIQKSYAGKRNSVENLDKMRDEVLSRLAEINVLATFDPTPCFHGEPPVVEIIGKVSGDSLHKYGFDHEQKQFEVKKATARNEDFLGQKESVNRTTQNKKRSQSG